MSEPRLAPALRVENLDVRFVDRGKAFSALSIDALDVSPGGSLALTGPSGCGKSTFFYVLAGLLKPARGRIAWGGDDLFSLGEGARDAWRRAHVGFIFQDFELLHELTPLQNVLVPATFARFSIDAATKARAAELLDRFGVPARSQATGSLSRGERQRVALARALLFDPPVLLADEPTASLDAESAAVVIETLAADNGRTVIVASHDRALVERLQREVRLAHGKVAEASA